MKLSNPYRLLLRLLALMLMAAVLLFWVKMGYSCLLRRATGIPCLTCGMTRAWFSAFRLDFLGAFSHHPMFWSIPLLGLMWLFIDQIPRRCAGAVSVVILAGYLVCYVIRLAAV